MQTTENNCNVLATKEVVSDLYKNVTMNVHSIKVLVPLVYNEEMKAMLNKQLQTYQDYTNQVEKLCQTLNFEPTPAPKAVILMAEMGLKSKMIANKSTTHVAKIMLQGTLNGIIDLYRLLNHKADVHPDVVLLAKQVLRYEEGCLENVKAFL